MYTKPGLRIHAIKIRRIFAASYWTWQVVRDQLITALIKQAASWWGSVGSSDPTITSLKSFFSVLKKEFLPPNIDLHRLERLSDVRLRGTSPRDISELITRFDDLSTATMESDRGLVMTFMAAISPHTQLYNKLFSENPATLSEAKKIARDWLAGRSMKTRTTTPALRPSLKQDANHVNHRGHRSRRVNPVAVSADSSLNG
ncbi:hypothetical protein V1514DRAFT_340930 [Lipomyces japonicus]|uniref:uncharacterized protein n=1 Tax=Lipomyces japonicus TaxID=56871 RepID=UPI0034CDFE63